MELEPLGQFGDAELVDVAEELLHHVERMRDRLDQVVGFVASDCHRESRGSFPVIRAILGKRSNLDGHPKRCQSMQFERELAAFSAFSRYAEGAPYRYASDRGDENAVRF